MRETKHFLCRHFSGNFYRYARPLSDLEFKTVAACGYLPEGWGFVHFPVTELNRKSRKSEHFFARKVIRRGIVVVDPLDALIETEIPRYRLLRKKIACAKVMSAV